MGQTPYILQSEGTVPSEFLKPPAEKAAEDLDKIKKNKSGRKEKKEFYIQSNYLIDRLLKSGKVLFNDSLSHYVNSVADKILENDPELREQLRFYIVKSPYVNAFCTEDGIIFINVGMIAQLENEAQLAFILCHEIAHFTEGHSLEGYLENRDIEKGRGSYASMSIDERLSQRSNFSKSHEFQADNEGYKRFEKTGYDVKAAAEVFFVLQFSHLPFDEIPFETNFLENAHYQLPETALLDEIDEISFDEEDDEYGTHPNTASRRARLTPFIESQKTTGKEFLLSKSTFSRLQKLSRYEMTRLYLITRSYSDALYNSFLLEKKYPGDIRNELYKAKALMGLAAYKADNDLLDVCTDSHDIEGESQQLSHILIELDKDDLLIISAINAFETYKRYPKQAWVRDIAQQAITNLVVESDIHFADLQKTPELVEEDSTVQTDSTVQEVADSTAEVSKNKYDKLKSKLKSNLSDEPFYYAFSDYLTDRDLVEMFITAQQIADEDDDYDIAEEDQGQLNIDKVLLIQPFYFDYSERRGKGYNTVKSEDSKLNYISVFDKLSKKSGLEVDMFSPLTMQDDDVNKFNDYAVLNDWLYEASKNNGYNITSSSYELAQQLKEKYNTRYVATSGVISIDESKREDVMRAACSCILVYSIPLGIYFAARPLQQTYLFYTIYDLETGKEVNTFFYDYRASDHEYLIKSSLYDAFLKTKNL